MTNEQRLDANLVRQILSGDEEAFEALYKRHKQRIHQYIFKRIGDWHYAEELTDDTFLKAKENLETLRKPQRVLNWMFRLANQLIAGWHRKRKKHNTMQSAIDVYEVEGESAASAVVHQIAQEYAIAEEGWAALMNAIAQLPELEQQMLKLQYKKSYKEIAEICDVSVSSVRNRLSRAKKKLKAWGAAWKAANAEGLDLDFSEFHKGTGR